MEVWILMVMFVAGGQVHYIEQPTREACYQAGNKLDQNEQPYAWDCASKKAMVFHGYVK